MLSVKTAIRISQKKAYMLLCYHCDYGGYSIEKSSASAVFVGIDRADDHHDVCLSADDGWLVKTKIEHTPEAIECWVSDLRKKFGKKKIAICLEQSRGSLIYALMKYENLILYPVNPKSLAKFRQAFRPTGAKDDPFDAEFLLELVYTHR